MKPPNIRYALLLSAVVHRYTRFMPTTSVPVNLPVAFKAGTVLEAGDRDKERSLQALEVYLNEQHTRMSFRDTLLVCALIKQI